MASYSPDNLPYDRDEKSELDMGHDKSKALSNLRIISFKPSSNVNAIRYGLSDASMEIIKNEFDLIPNPEVPIQLLPLLIDHVNDIEEQIVPASSLAPCATGGSISGDLVTGGAPSVDSLEVNGTVRADRFLINSTTTTDLPTYLVGETNGTGYRYQWDTIDNFGGGVTDLITIGHPNLPEMNIRGDAVRITKDCALQIPCASLNLHAFKLLIGSEAKELNDIDLQTSNVIISDDTAINGDLSVTGTARADSIYINSTEVINSSGQIAYSSLTGTPTIPSVYNPAITIQGTNGLTGSGVINLNQQSGETVTLSHADTSTQPSVDNSDGTVIQDVILDTYGHITELRSKNLDDQYTPTTSLAAVATGGKLLADQLPTDLSIEISNSSKRFIFGSGGGSVALTQNDGKGNASLTFNHPAGVPDNTATNQSASRIEAAVDNSTGALFFEVGNSTSQGQNVNLSVIHEMKTAFSRCYTNLGVKVQPNYELDVNGTARASRFLIDSTTSTDIPSYLIGETNGIGHRYQFDMIKNFGASVSDTVTIGNSSLPETVVDTGYLSCSRQVNERTKLRVWGTSSNFGIGMESSHTFGGLNDYAMTFCMTGGTTSRGFWWGTASHDKDSEGAMSLTRDGRLTTASGVRVGFGEQDTTAPGSTGMVVKDYVAVESGNSRSKFRLWNTDEKYSIGMESGYNFGGLNNEYATVFSMNNSTNRGWWWGDSDDTKNQGAMSLTTDGRLTIANGIRVGFGEDDTTSPESTGMRVNGTVQATRFLADQTTAGSLPTYLIGETNGTGFRYQWGTIDNFGGGVTDLLTIGHIGLPEMNIRGESIRISRDCANQVPSSTLHLHSTKILIGSAARESDQISVQSAPVIISDPTRIDETLIVAKGIRVGGGAVDITPPHDDGIEVKGTVVADRFKIASVSTNDPVYLIGEDGSENGHRYRLDTIKNLGGDVRDSLVIGNSILPILTLKGTETNVVGNMSITSNRLILGGFQLNTSTTDNTLNFGITPSDKIATHEVVTHSLNCPGLQTAYTLSGGGLATLSVPSGAITNLGGGAIETTNYVYLKWTDMIYGLGANTPAGGDFLGEYNRYSGYIGITMPPVGTIIQRYVFGDGDSVTTTEYGIPFNINYGEQLYYEFTPGTAGYETTHTKFRLVDNSNHTLHDGITSNWVLIASFNPFDKTLKWLPGMHFLRPGTFYDSITGSYSMVGDIVRAHPDNREAYDTTSDHQFDRKETGSVVLYAPGNLFTNSLTSAVNVMKTFFGV